MKKEAYEHVNTTGFNAEDYSKYSPIGSYIILFSTFMYQRLSIDRLTRKWFNEKTERVRCEFTDSQMQCCCR